MNVLVDTCVWSLVLRRTKPRPDLGEELRVLALAGRIVMVGPIRQELLSGVKQKNAFTRLAAQLHAFDDLILRSDDYERAAMYFNQARARGVQGSNTDFLLCAIAAARGLSIFTVDKDFERYAEFLPITLHHPSDAADMAVREKHAAYAASKKKPPTKKPPTTRRRTQ